MNVRHALSALAAFVALPVSGALADTTVATDPVEPITAVISHVLSDTGRAGEFLNKKDGAAVAEFYALNGHRPVWSSDRELTESAKAVIAHLRDAAADGLDPTDYPTPDGTRFTNIVQMALADVLISQSVLTYARHAYGGRLDPAKISKNFDYKPNVLDPVDVLGEVMSADDRLAILASYNPPHPEFADLKRQLAEARASAEMLPPVIPDGKYMQLGRKDERVPLLRKRLGLDPELEDEPTLFDESMDVAVRAYQKRTGLSVDGIVGPGTLGMLNRAAEDHESTILVNMERWRWMPRELGDLYVRVNVPNFNLEIRRNGEIFHATRIVVGKPKNQTPIFSDEIEHVVVNPTWNVPASIARKEFLPAVRQNRSALNGYNVYANINGRFRRVDPTFVNWSTVDMRRIQIKQPPGRRNALGQVKFMFPNRHAVYLHDTPSKSLFKKDYRAYSHGCMRVNNPWDFAEALLDADPKLSGELLKKMVGGREQQLNLERHIPVHITYFTAWIDDGESLQIRSDLYGHDARMKSALGLT